MHKEEKVSQKEEIAVKPIKSEPKCSCIKETRDLNCKKHGA